MESFSPDSTEVQKKINDSSKITKDGKACLSDHEIHKIAEKFGLTPLEIEVAALKIQIIPTRYQRNISTITPREQIQLIQSAVAIIGCGGLGGHISELITRLGIGDIVLVDGDQFDESNLNRQLLCTEHSIGTGKAVKAAERVEHIHSSIRSQTYSLFFHANNIKEIICNCQVVVDALDNIPDRFVLQKACREMNIPLVHGAVHGLYGQISTLFPEDPGFELIYGSSERFKELDWSRKEKTSVPSMTPALIASLQATEVMKILLKRDHLLRNRLLFINLEIPKMNMIELNNS